MSWFMASWAELIAAAMAEASDPGPLIASTLTDEEAAVKFDASYGVKNGKPFTAWTAARVYFPLDYDGAEGVGSVPRDPCDEVTEHQGGGG
jgi:hypothetical protein